VAVRALDLIGRRKTGKRHGDRHRLLIAILKHDATPRAAPHGGGQRIGEWRADDAALARGAVPTPQSNEQ